mgnify:CR=1 FL=1
MKSRKTVVTLHSEKEANGIEGAELYLNENIAIACREAGDHSGSYILSYCRPGGSAGTAGIIRTAAHPVASGYAGAGPG